MTALSPINRSFRRALALLPLFWGVLVVLLTGCAIGPTASRPPTATPTIAPTSTLIPTATATPIPNPYPPYAGTLVWNDPLEGNNEGHEWSEGGPCRFLGDAYQVVQQANYGGACLEGSSQFSNFALQVDLTFLQSSSTEDAGGITFRADPNNPNNQYELNLYANGHYYLAICAGYDCSRVVFQGICHTCQFGPTQPDTLAVVANGSSFAFYVNGQQLASGTDSTYSQGLIGFFGVAFSSTSIMAYQHVEVWQW